MKSIKIKLMLAIAIMMILSLTVVASFSYWKSSDLLTGQTEDTLKIQTDAISKECSLWLSAHQSDMEMLANVSNILTSCWVDFLSMNYIGLTIICF